MVILWTQRTHNVVVNDSSPMIFARPKSASLIVNSLSTSKMFSGLISRCTMFRSCCSFRQDTSMRLKSTV